MKPETLIVTSILVILTLGVPKRWVLLPFIAAACMVPTDQRIIIYGLDFTTLRFVVLAGMMRLYFRGEVRQIAWNTFDKLVFAWVITGGVVYVLQYGAMSAVIYKCGVLYDCLGLYWIFRQTLVTWADVDRVFKLFAVGVLLSTPLIILERITEESMYRYLGSARGAFSHGRFRCSGPFPHFIMMGLFWATLVPVFFAYYRAKQSRSLYIAAAVGAVICVVLSASSTPLMALFATAGFGAMWKYRASGKKITWGVAGMLLGLHLVMKKPVWHLMCRVNIFSGSTGWHRFILFDKFVNNFSEWCILGCRGVAHWGIYAGDITNQYVLEGVRGGLVTLVLFIIVIVKAVQALAVCSLEAPSHTRRVVCWGICVSILSHAVAFWGVSYFGQIMLLMYLTFAIAGFAYGWHAQLASAPQAGTLEVARMAFQRGHSLGVRG